MTEPVIQVTDKDVLAVNVNDFIEALRAQRTEALDAQAQWFAKFCASQKRVKELEAELAKFKSAPLEAVK